MNGWLKTQTDARAIITALEYNELGQVDQKCVKGGSPTIPYLNTRDTYDQGNAGYFNVGRLTTAWRGLTTANGVCTGTPTAKIERRFDYDAAGRPARQVYVNPTEAATPVNKTLAFEYWPDGSLKRGRLAGGSWTGDYSYDAAGELYSRSTMPRRGERPARLLHQLRHLLRPVARPISSPMAMAPPPAFTYDASSAAGSTGC